MVPSLMCYYFKEKGNTKAISRLKVEGSQLNPFRLTKKLNCFYQNRKILKKKNARATGESKTTAIFHEFQKTIILFQLCDKKRVPFLFAKDEAFGKEEYNVHKIKIIKYMCSKYSFI